MESLIKDLRYSLRSLARHRWFTAMVILSLGLGIGINTTIYALTSSFLLRPLPYPEADRLALVVSTFARMGWSLGAVSVPEMTDLRERSKLFETVTLWDSDPSPNLVGEGTPEKIHANFVTSEVFRLLEARPAVGRLLTPQEDREIGGHPVAVLSHAFWQRRFGGNPGVVGRRIDLSGQLFTVIGVTAAGFQDLRADTERTDVWLPMSMGKAFFGEDMFENRLARQYIGLVKLRDGVTVEQAQAELDKVARELEAEHPYEHEGRGLRLMSIYDWYYQDLDGPAKTLAVGAFLVLLLCCVNIATLILVRGRARIRDIAVRVALGAERAQVIRQILLESLLLAMFGGVFGTLLAWWLTRSLVGLGGLELPAFATVELDSGALLFSLILTALTGLFFGLLPAWQLARTDLRTTLQGSVQKTAGKSGVRQRHLVAMAEVGLATVLLIGAGLTVKSLYQLLRTDIGFDISNLLTLQVDLGGHKYDEPAAIQRFIQETQAGLEAIPSVRAAALWGPSMLGNARWNLRVSRMDMAPDDPEGRIMVQRLQISPGALKTVGIPLLQGRDCTRDDSQEGPPYSSIIDKRLAQRLFPGENALGKRFYRGDNVESQSVIVGIAADVLNRGRTGDRSKVAGDVYDCLLEEPIRTLSVLIRYESDPGGTLEAARAVLARQDPDLVPFDVATMDERQERVEAAPRLHAVLVGFYGLVATVLAVIGIYGVLTYTVQQRSWELAIRSSLGAQPRDLLWMVVRQGMVWAALGMVIGLAATVLLSKYLESLLFQVSRLDPTMYVGVGILLGLVAFVSCYLPARRAGSVNPLDALRAAE